MKVISEDNGWQMLEDKDGRLYIQPPDNLPPIPYWIGDTTNLPGLERSLKQLSRKQE